MLMRHRFRPDHDSQSSAEAHRPLDNGFLESHKVHMENAVLRVSVANYAIASAILNIVVDTCHLHFSLLAKLTYGRVQIVMMTVKQRLEPPKLYRSDTGAESVALFLLTRVLECPGMQRGAGNMEVL